MSIFAMEPPGSISLNFFRSIQKRMATAMMASVRMKLIHLRELINATPKTIIRLRMLKTMKALATQMFSKRAAQMPTTLKMLMMAVAMKRRAIISDCGGGSGEKEVYEIMGFWEFR